MAEARGTFGRPPVGAPYQVASGNVGPTADQLAMARQNEKVLPPFNPSPSLQTPGQRLAQENAQAAPVEAGFTIILMEPDVEPTVIAPESPPHPHSGGPTIPSAHPHQPAASDSDTPARGIPQRVLKGKEVTGGWGDVGEASYFPLDGSELRQRITSLLHELEARMVNDLRFTLATTYPRVNARVDITVECYANDQTFQIAKVMVPHTATPLVTAKRHADECCFVVRAEHVEMTPEGESVTPPNQVRMELGLDVPRKRAIETPSGRRMFVDVAQ